MGIERVDLIESPALLARIASGRHPAEVGEELAAYRARALSPANPAFRHCEAQAFVGSDGGGEGHVVASVDRRLPGVGFLGFLEATGGSGRELLEAGAAWLEERGAGTVVAPFDLTILHRSRLALRSAGFRGEPPCLPEDVERLAGAGFTVAERWATGVAPTDGPAGFPMPEGPLAVRPVDAKRLDDELGLLHRLALDGFAGIGPWFVPFDEDEFRYWYEPVAHAIDPRFVRILEVDGDPAGFCFAYPEGGRLIVKTLVLAPAFRGRGLSAALIGPVHRLAVEAGLGEAVYALVREESVVRRMRAPGLRIEGEYVTLRRP